MTKNFAIGKIDLILRSGPRGDLTISNSSGPYMTFTFLKSHMILVSSLAMAVALTSPAFVQDRVERSEYIGETEKKPRKH